MKLLVFAGTYEGRILCEALNNAPQIDTHVSVATEYGLRGLDTLSRIHTHCGRLDSVAIADFIIKNNIDTVIDATHPYATEVTANIKLAVAQANKLAEVCLLRLLRGKVQDEGYCKTVANTATAIEYLKGTAGNVLVTTGSKELHAYTEIGRAHV
jgi:precorrin-6x reductase